MDIFTAVVSLIIFFAISLVVFLVCRELVCWYFKINHIVETLDAINSSIGSVSDRLLPGVWKKLDESNNLLRQVVSSTSQMESPPSGSAVAKPRHVTCPYCEQLTPLDNGSAGSLQTCRHCQESFDIQ